jgi:hypothetical protein
MRKVLSVCFVLLGLMLCVPAFAQDVTPIRNVPTVTGLYYSSTSESSRMELATSSGFKTSGVAKAAFSYGIAKVKGKWLYHNSTASIQLPDRRPAFTLVSQIDVSTQAIALLRLDIKKDRREAQYCEASVWTGVNAGNQDTIPLTVTRISNTNTLTIIPQSDLPAGEYLLITDAGKGYDGYDFGVK